jgi:2-amino-4-hydroxy-6-hydroxymethyldihydropteridine diphosphokinase
MARCLVGCGSNVGKRRALLDRAVELLRHMPGVSLVAVSRYRDTRPIGGPPGQPAYLNGACLLDTDLPPHELLGLLAAVENTLHRERCERWGPRTVDLDLLLYGDAVLETASLTVPHPRMTTRRFVLEPCVEIAPEAIHPRAACSLAELLESISTPRPHIVVIGVPGSGAAAVAAAVADAALARHVRAPGCWGELLAGGPAAADPQAWQDALVAAMRPLRVAGWPDDPHGSVVDYWLPALLIAAETTAPASAARGLQEAWRRAAPETMPPHVALVLVASAETLRARLSQGLVQDVHAGDFRADDPAAVRPAVAAGAVACAGDDAAVSRLMRLQDRLIAAVDRQGPRATVTIPADDVAQAVLEAVAAVEAMA